MYTKVKTEKRYWYNQNTLCYAVKNDWQDILITFFQNAEITRIELVARWCANEERKQRLSKQERLLQKNSFFWRVREDRVR